MAFYAIKSKQDGRDISLLKFDTFEEARKSNNADMALFDPELAKECEFDEKTGTGIYVGEKTMWTTTWTIIGKSEPACDSKVGLGIDLTDYPRLKSLIDNACDKEPTVCDWHTPDNIYRFFYWEAIDWKSEDSLALRAELDHIRHAWMQIPEAGETQSDVLTHDDNGCDEEFETFFTEERSINMWFDDTPIEPLMGKYIPLSRSRLYDILVDYVNNDLAATELEYIYDALTSVCDHAEIRALGFGFCIPDDNEAPDFECTYPNDKEVR